MVDFRSWVVTALEIFLFILFLRLVIDYVRMFRPYFRPRGILLPIFEIVYTITDKPLEISRRFIPPVRMGPVAIDLSFIVFYFLIRLLIYVLR